EHGRSRRGRANPAGARTKLPDPGSQHLVLEKGERALPEGRRDLRRGAVLEGGPGPFDLAGFLPAGGAAGQGLVELPGDGLLDLPGQAVDEEGGQFAAFHEAAPSEKWAFRVSTARKMRVLTAPTEMLSTAAISA